jgi:hypothetical protein
VSLVCLRPVFPVAPSRPVYSDYTEPKPGCTFESNGLRGVTTLLRSPMACGLRPNSAAVDRRAYHVQHASLALECVAPSRPVYSDYTEPKPGCTFESNGLRGVTTLLRSPMACGLRDYRAVAAAQSAYIPLFRPDQAVGGCLDQIQAVGHSRPHDPSSLCPPYADYEAPPPCPTPSYIAAIAGLFAANRPCEPAFSSHKRSSRTARTRKHACRAYIIVSFTWLV